VRVLDASEALCGTRLDLSFSRFKVGPLDEPLLLYTRQVLNWMLQVSNSLRITRLDDELTSVAEEFAAVMRHVGKIVINFDEEMKETVDFQAMRR
jgi:hypothetical protein